MDCGSQLKNRQRRGLKSSLHLYINVSNWAFVGLRVPGSVSKCAESATGRCSRQWRQVAIGAEVKTCFDFFAGVTCVQRRYSMKYARRELPFQEDLLSSLEKKLQLGGLQAQPPVWCRWGISPDQGLGHKPSCTCPAPHPAIAVIKQQHSIKCSTKTTLWISKNIYPHMRLTV